nr:DUF2730 family protein [uncultured Rhodopila sp.]
MISIEQIDWQKWAALAALLGAIGSVLMVFVRRWLRSEFASAHSVAAVERRVGTLEQSHDALPGQEDFHSLGTRVAHLETGGAVLQSSVNDIRESIKGIGRNVELLLQHALRGDDA